jgi:gliding motility-associated-like protein
MRIKLNSLKILGLTAACFFLYAQYANAQGKCSTATALTLGADDNTCNSQNISGPTKLSNNTPPITTVNGPACGLASGVYSNWFSFTGDGTTIRVKVSGENKVVGMTVFENQTCGATMTAKVCGTYPDDGIPHVLDVATISGASYLVAIVGSSSSLSGKVCAYKTNGNPYKALCDPIMYPVPTTLPVKTKDLDCFTSSNNVATSSTLTAPATPCSNNAKWWWGEFTATSTKTDLYLWGKDETNAAIEVLEDFCGSAPQNEVFCNNNTGAKDNPNWGTMVTVPGKKYRVIVKSASSMSYGNLCISSEPPEAAKTTCTGDMSFEGGTSNGWATKWGSYHLVTAPGSVFKWDLYNSTAPGSLYQVTTGAGRDPLVSFIPVVAPGGGIHSFRIGSVGTAEGAAGFVNGVKTQLNHSAATSASYCFTVSAANAGFGYKYAVVMDYVTHPFELQPLFDVVMTLQSTGDTIQCGKFQHVPNDGVSPFQFVGSNTDVSGKNHGPIFTPWTDVITDLSGYAGQVVCVTFKVRDCEGGGSGSCCPSDSTASAGSHWAYAYIDTYCVPMDITVPEFCAGAASITICAPAGYKSYSWPAGQPGLAGAPTTQCVTILNPVAGNTYTVNMMSITNCPTIAKVKLKIIPVTKTADTVLCSSVPKTIALSVVVVDPTKDPPYTYTWSNGLGSTSTVNATVSATTTYTVTVSNATGCITTETIKVTLQVCGPTVVATGKKICTGTCASITAVGSGGTAPYNYTWTGGLTGATQSFCPASTTVYTVTVSDAGGATGTDTVIVAINPVMTLTVTPKNATCKGSNDGSASVAVGGGTAAFTYAWAALGGTGVTTTSTLTPGTYTVTVTDSKGCTKTATTTITEPPPVTASTNTTPANCGTNTGTATATGGGGTGTVTYSWSPGGATTSTINSLGAGTYIVIVTDANNCTATSAALVNSTGGVTATIQSHIDATCVTPGSAVVSTAGGTAPFVYSWSPSGGTAATASSLPAGTYTVVVTDANSCVSNTTVTITVPAGPTASTTKVDDNCGKGKGSATVTVAGGTGPFTLSWSLGAAGNTTISNLLTGSYTVKVTDANGCTATSVAVVGNLNGPTTTTASTNVTCFGAANGTAQTTATGGAGSFTYSWAPSAQTTASITALAPGTYTVNISDAAGCTISSSVTITEPPQITIAAVVKDANCATANGSITVTAGGGTGTLTATWQPSGGPGFTASNLAANSYTVTVTDASGCTATSGVIVSNIGAPTIAVGPVTNVLCKGGNNGSATITINGGSTPYNIVWTPASVGTGTTISSLTAGGYTVAVTDALNCIAGTIVTITEPPLLTAAASATSPNCPGSGSTSVTVGGGTPGYTYNWMPGSATTQTVTGLSGGTYTVTVTDANGCTQVSTATITVPAALVLVTAPIDGTCGNSTGSASVNVTGGTPGYAYNWMPSGGNGKSAVNLPANTFTVTVTDSKGCTETATAVVGNTPPIAVAASVTANVSCKGGNDGSVTATPGGGTAPIIYTWTPVGGGGAIASGLIAGTYTVNVIDSKGCTAVSSATVTEPPLLTIAAPAVPMICIGQSATLTATAAGGTINYTYGWMPGSLSGPSVSVSPVVTTTYSVAVVDSKGCTTSSTVIVTIRQPLTVTAGAGKNVCAGSSTTVTAIAGGGDGTYTYTWQPGNTLGSSISVTPVGTQIYTVTVSDGCGTPVATSVVTVQSVTPILTPAFTPDSTAGCAPLCVTFANTTTANNIKVFPVPVAGFIADPKSTSILTPLINFTDNSTPDVVKWNWNFGDVPNSGSTKKNPTYTYKDTGKYQVQLIVTTAYGCVDTIEDAVIIHGDYMFYVPNAFSPNGDGINDTFFPKGYMIDASCYKMLIFDRWGNLIFSSTDLNLGWDGKANGGAEKAQQDVYVWKIETCDYQKTKYAYVGHVSLVK